MVREAEGKRDKDGTHKQYTSARAIITSNPTPPAAPPAIAPTFVLLPLPPLFPCGVAIAVTTYVDVC